MNTCELKKAVLAGAFDPTFKTLYGEERISSAQIRYANAIEAFESIYGAKEEAVLLSVPGRSEITGNHTDHNHGRVIAASVDCDVIAVAALVTDNYGRQFMTFDVPYVLKVDTSFDAPYLTYPDAVRLDRDPAKWVLE